MKLRIGQIGIGAWGRFHCKILSELPGVSLAGIYDIEPATGLRYSKMYGTKAFESPDDLTANIDALIITAPTSEHFRIAEQALSNGIHVFVEKPICANIAQADKLIKLSENKGLVLQVGHIERFNPAFQAIASQEFSPYYLEGYRTASFSPRGTDVSVVLDLMIHDIDVVLKIVNHSVKNVSGLGTKVASENIDFANAQITFDNGCVANLTASRVAADKIRQIVFYQQQEQFTLDFIARKTVKSHFDSNAQYGKSPEELTSPAASATNPLKQELLAFINEIQQEKVSSFSAVAATDALKVVLEIEQKIGAGSLKAAPDLKSGNLAASKKLLKY